MNIQGKFVTLRAVEKEDLELMRNMLNDPEIEGQGLGWAFPISKTQQEEWYKNNFNANILRVIIEIKGEGAIGAASITNIDWKNRRATFGGMKLLNKKNRSKGIGTDATMALCRYIFQELQLNRLDLCFFEHKLDSKKMCCNCGAVMEGVYREYVYKNGKYYNVMFGAILKKDYLKTVSENNYWGK